eukprot:17530-Pelagococcus_subviridis.AAC.3
MRAARRRRRRVEIVAVVVVVARKIPPAPRGTPGHDLSLSPRCDPRAAARDDRPSRSSRSPPAAPARR